MQTYQAKDFTSRELLDQQVASDLGKTPEKKDAKITGTTDELRALFLSHGQSVWGVEVEAVDFIPEEVTPRINRGTIYKSNLNYAKD